MQRSVNETPASTPAISSPSQAHQLASHLIDARNALLALVEEETALVRAGKIAAAIALDAQKSELSRRYVTAIGHLKANRSYFASSTPELLATLHRHHDAVDGRRTRDEPAGHLVLRIGPPDGQKST